MQAYTDRIYTLSSASNGRWRRISSGSVSAAITTNSEIPLLRVLVAEHRHEFKSEEGEINRKQQENRSAAED
jgi:hypothetical protein